MSTVRRPTKKKPSKSLQTVEEGIHYKFDDEQKRQRSNAKQRKQPGQSVCYNYIQMRDRCANDGVWLGTIIAGS